MEEAFCVIIIELSRRIIIIWNHSTPAVHSYYFWGEMMHINLMFNNYRIDPYHNFIAVL